MLDTIKLDLASLSPLTSATIAGVPVRRSSLVGFDVGGVTLDLEDAARVLADAPAQSSRATASIPGAFASAHFKTCDWSGCAGCKSPALPADLLVAPLETFPGHRAETWRKGPAADARIRKLRRMLGASVNTRSLNVTQRLSSELGAERVTIAAVEITYAASPHVPRIATT